MTSVVFHSVFRLALIVGLSVMVGCTSTPKGPTLAETTLAEAEKKPEAEKSVPNYIQQALLNGNRESRTDLQMRNKRFDVSVNAVPAQAFFLGLVADAGVNVVTHPDLEGDITLELSNVSVAEVLNVVRDVYGYEYRVRDDIYTIYPRKIRTEIFPINYLDVKRVGVSDTHVNIGQAQSTGGRQSSGGQSQNQSDGSADILSLGNDGGESQSSRGQGINPGSRVQTLNKTDFWEGIKITVEAIVGGSTEGRMVMVNPQAGLVAVTAMPSELSAVRDFLIKSELSVKRQVVLEAQILEVELSEGFQAGVNWTAISGQISAAKNLADGFGVGNAEGAPVGEFRPISTNYVYEDADGVLQNLSVPAREAVGSTVAGILQVKDITQLLSLLETQGAVQVLSSPRVSTVNNQKAVIRVGSDEFFVTGLTNSTTSSAATTTTAPEVQLTSFFSGISLDVTPQIAEDGDVILHIHPIVSSVTDQLKELNVGNSKVSLPLALREIRESDSIVRAQSGQVIVLGGLMQQSSDELNGKRPWLGDVPGLNLLFKTKNRIARKTELVILVKPIVVGEDTWQDQLSEYRQSSQSMGEEYRSK
jgi:MSHA biogenesis protein MshL